MAMSTVSPFNSDKKARLERLSGQLYAYIEKCFTATNNLIDLIHQHLPGQTFQKIGMQESESIKENVELFRSRVNEIKLYLETKRLHMEALIGRELFQKLMSDDIDLDEKISMVEELGYALLGLGLEAIVVAILIALNTILTTIICGISALAACTIASIGLGLLVLSVSLLITAISVHIVERNQLDEEIRKFEKAVNDFRPVSDLFYDKISMIRAMILLLGSRRIESHVDTNALTE